MQIVAVPGGAEHAHTRKQLLDRVDGLVIVVDVDPTRAEANAESIKELHEALGAYGRSLEELPFVVQYNKRDLGDPYAIEELHRRLQFGSAAVFETVATEGKGVLQVLSTISKGVIRSLRENETTAPSATPAPRAAAVMDAPPARATLAQPAASAPTQTRPPAAARPAPMRAQPDLMSDAEPLPDLDHEPSTPPSRAETVMHLDTPASPRAPEIVFDAEPLAAEDPQAVMEAAILSEGEGADEGFATDDAVMRTELAFDKPFDQLANEKPAPGARFGADLRVVSVGTAEKAGERGVRVPLVLGNDDGETLTLALTVQLDPLLEDGPGDQEEDPG